MPESVLSPVASILPSLAEIHNAAEIVYRFMPATPQYRWPLINERAGAEVWIKHENHTPVGNFKIRGGLVYMDWLERERPEITTVVTATRGNHGQSIAYAAGQIGVRAVVVVPHGNSREKNLAVRALGAELVEFGNDFQAAKEHALELAKDNSWHHIESFEPLLVAGVATYTLELLTSCPELDTLYIPIGIGSGVSGAIAVRDALELPTKIVGVISSHAPATALSYSARHVVEHASATAIADGVACQRPNPAALGVFLAGLDRIVQVTDNEVAEAMRIYFSDTHNVAEGAGALGLAAVLKDRSAGITASYARLGTVLCGGNVDTEVFAKVLAGGS